MKKIISLLLAIAMMLSVAPVFAADAEAVLRVQALGIIKGDENGMRLEDNITRAEFSAIICRLAGISNPTGMKQSFDDVDENHWANGYISTAVSLGIVNGMGDGTFAPEANITYNQALKMMVCLLGYGPVAENKGGWPNGYIAQAGTLGLTSGADVSAEYAIRGEIITIIDNALDTYVMRADYGKADAYIVDEYTLAETLGKSSEAVKFEGVFTENAYLSTEKATPATEEGYVKVNGKTLRSNSDYSDLVGLYVFGWMRENASGKQEVVCMEADETKNNILTVDADDAEFYNGYVEYYDSSDKLKKFNIASGVTYTYNGRYTRNQANYINSTSAVFTFVDNTEDNKADIIMIVDSESFVIDKINEKNSSVYFADDKLFRGRRGFELFSDDDDKKIKLTDKDGNDIEFSSVSVGDAITLSVSEDLKLATAVVSSDRISGTVEEIDNDNKVRILDNFYKSDLNLRLGQEAEFILDADGVIIGINGVEKTELTYGYIIDAKVSGTMDSALSLLIVEALAPQKEVKEKDGTETISYYLQNDVEKEYVCDTKIRFSRDRIDGITNNIDSATLVPDDLKDCIAGFELDADGNIRTLCVYSVADEDYSSCELNADLLSFGGQSVTRGFCTDDNTQIICIPKKAQKSADDYGVRVYITDGGSYSTYGVKGRSEYDINDRNQREKYNREPVDVLLIKGDMDASKPYPIQEDADICIVGESVEVLDENGNHVRKVEVLNGDQVVEIITEENSPAYDVAKTLRMGDLIRYVNNNDGKAVNIAKLASVQGLRNYSSSGNLYGIAYDIAYSAYDYMSNDKVDIIEMDFEDGLGTKEVKYFNDGDQVVYLYNRARGFIEAATTDDIMTQQSGGTPSKLFVYTKNNDAQAIVIIND